MFGFMKLLHRLYFRRQLINLEMHPGANFPAPKDAHLDILAAKAAGEKPDAFWPSWLHHRDEYEAIVPA
jgi:hypothetical protein